MKRTALAAALLGLASLLAPGATAAPGPRVVVLDGVHVVLHADTRQVVTARHTHGHDARVTYWTSAVAGDTRAADWHAVRRTSDGRTGYGGLVVGRRRHQGTGTTPLGTYRLISSFGTHPAAAGARLLPYRQIRPGDFWVEDNTSRFYNRYRNQRQGGFHWRESVARVNGSERLSDYPRQYEYSIVTSFNEGQVRHRGAGIFLHVNGSATAGCVSAPRAFLAMLMRRLDPTRDPVIAIGR